MSSPMKSGVQSVRVAVCHEVYLVQGGETIRYASIWQGAPWTLQQSSNCAEKQHHPSKKPLRYLKFPTLWKHKSGRPLSGPLHIPSPFRPFHSPSAILPHFLGPLKSGVPGVSPLGKFFETYRCRWDLVHFGWVNDDL